MDMLRSIGKQPGESVESVLEKKTKEFSVRRFAVIQKEIRFRAL